MTRKPHVQRYPQAWPFCWLRMQWDIALWTARWGQDPRWRLHVRWSEGQLAQATDPTQFRDMTQAYVTQLEQTLGARASWDIQVAGDDGAHEIEMRWVTPGQEGVA
jgi:hypothetical protein